MGKGPTAVSRLGEDDSREAQILRAVNWLLAQDGGPVVLMIPRRAVESTCISRVRPTPSRSSNGVLKGPPSGSKT